MKAVRLVSLCVLILLFAAADNATAQDTHYWTNQYGPRSMLLSGAVIGSVTDMSATYYNPGALGYIEKPELLLSANAYQVETLKIEDGGGDGVDLSSSQFNLLPNMIAGAFRKSWLGKNKVAYSFLTRHRFDAEVRGVRTDRIDILPDPGSEEFAGYLRAEVDAKELWAGVTWARGVNERVGVGITTFLSVRTEKGTDEFFAQALTDSSDISLIFNVDNFSASTYSLLWKAGVGFDFKPLTIGVTLTTPNLQLFGSGEAAINSTVVRVDRDNDGTPENSFETDFQEEVDANYKSPLSIGVGAGYFFERTQIHFSAEWFSEIDAYDVLELEPFRSQTTGESQDRSLQQKRDSVTNFALGLRQALSERWAGYLSFNTDYSAFNEESDISVTGLDIVHATGGATAVTGRTTWMLGLSYAWGNETATQLIDLSPDPGGSVANPTEQVEISYTRLTFLIGFKVGL